MSDGAMGWRCVVCEKEFTLTDRGSHLVKEHVLATKHEVVSVKWRPVGKPAGDPVNSPSHYTSGKIEVIDFIEDQGLGFHEGNVVKYVARAGKKDPDKHIQDLEKARWYLDRRIKNLKEAAE